MQTILSNLFVKGPSVTFGGCVYAERKGDGGSQRMGDKCTLNQGTHVYTGAGVWEKPQTQAPAEADWSSRYGHPGLSHSHWCDLRHPPPRQGS